MSTSPPPPPTSNLPDIFSINGKLVPVIIILSGILFSGLSAMCVLSAFHHRRSRRAATDPRRIALARERERGRSKGEVEKGLCTPMMKTVNVEIGLEVGEDDEQRGWRTVMPVSLELTPDYSARAPPPPYASLS